ncbi:RNA-directed DNA polymerase [Paracoccus angustae]|uniref:RNA-directed DNA polymerase n=1 Tax=Paracoccus angustae TaxID=1671480 RepID=UPI00366F3946
MWGYADPIAHGSATTLNKEEFQRIERATDLAIERVLSKGSDDVFKPPTFSQSIEAAILAQKPDEFRKAVKTQTISFLKVANLTKERIGPTRRGLTIKDQNSFRQCAWLDPFDAVKYLAAAYLLFEKIESARIPKDEQVVHSHRLSQADGEIFDSNFGYDSFRARSSELSQGRIGKWKVVTDIANFFDRIGNHSLENHLLNIGCDETHVDLIKEMLLFWAGDRRSFGVPVGSDASRILSEAALLTVDSKMKDAGIIFIRYVDDYRIFADTRAEALKAIEILTNLLADEGLSLNSRKTDVFKIVNAEEIAQFANRFAAGEHEQINLEEKVEVVRAIRVSGRSSISRYYREPGKDTLKKIQAIPKDVLVKGFVDAPDHEVEEQIKLVVKYFIYADQDVTLLQTLIERKITSIYYIADALDKEHKKFSPEKCEEIKIAVFRAVEWGKCAYPLQVPILRISGLPSFADPTFVRAIVDGHLQTDSMLFYREAISLGAPCLDRARLRKLAMEVFQNVPDFVRRAIYCAVKNHSALSEDEKRPLLKNMEQHADDWFIARI